MRRIIIFACVLLLTGCQGQKKLSDNIKVQVQIAQVVSGNTIEVMGMGNQPTLVSQVRLLGIDAPDLQQTPWGNNAKERLQALINGQTVMLEFDLEGKDKFGRTLAYVWQDKVLLNEQLVKEGQALFVGRSPNHKYDKSLEKAQQWARLMGEGIWNPEKPMRTSPAEFRRQR
ncbi:thermonuclease family protein [Calothrix sp. 336/3]|uniref:thermonuclease family protein n=1 Tax=Calothrix sp. 336/3 TaxID=1337936 RepID=UPI0004E31A23|nr:thermonuclease family protein [Calothrix sp. 336/3]AKG20020.1 nuclease [Calothrix sp. 336/3]